MIHLPTSAAVEARVGSVMTERSHAAVCAAVSRETRTEKLPAPGKYCPISDKFSEMTRHRCSMIQYELSAFSTSNL